MFNWMVHWEINMIYPVKNIIKASLIALTLFFSLFTNSIAAEYEVPYPGFLARIQTHSKLGGFLILLHHCCKFKK